MLEIGKKIPQPAYRFRQEKIMVFRFNSEVFEYRIGPKAFHVIPILHQSMSNRIVYPITRTRRCG